MVTATEAQRRQNVEQTLASWRIEGFNPDDEYRALLDRYVAGELSLADVRAATDLAHGLQAKSAA